MMSKPTVVLAYSGGLDTSYCILYLQDQGFDVHAIHVNTGGFDEAEVEELNKRAHDMGAVQFRSINNEEEYYAKCIRYLLYGNVLRNNTYPGSRITVLTLSFL